MATATVTLQVEGMTCTSCVAVVRKALEGVANTSAVQVDLEKGLATLDYPSGGDVKLLIDAVSEDAGKKASFVKSEEKGPRTVQLKVEGMSCMGCVGSVRTALEAIDGTDKVDVNLEAGLATMEYPTGADESVLVKAVMDEAGKEATVV